jgi:hypothetical protein
MPRRGSATIVYALEFVAEDVAAGIRTPPTMFLLMIVVNLWVGIPAVLVGGVPIWLVFRSLRIRSPWLFALTGASLALCTYLALVAMGMGQPSDHPMTFWQNLGRPFHLPRIAAAMLAGGAGATAFRRIAIRPFPSFGLTGNDAPS